MQCHLVERILSLLVDPDEAVEDGRTPCRKTLKTLVKVCKVKTTVAVSTVLILFIILFVSKSQI